MQNRGALWIFTILLALACLWQLSFSWFTGGVEDDAVTESLPDNGSYWDSAMKAMPAGEKLDTNALKLVLQNRYIADHSNDKVHPLGFTYADCKKYEMSLGLDLQGGMAVTLEVSIPELVVALSDKSEDPAFQTAIAEARKAMVNSDDDFITLFDREYRKVAPNGRLSAIFSNGENASIFDPDADNAGIIEALRNQAKAAVDNTERIMRTRIDKFGVSQPIIQKQQLSGRIQIELPGVKDKTRVRKVLQSTANLEFWETYDNIDVFPALKAANEQLATTLNPGLAVDTVKKDSSAAFEKTLSTGALVSGASTGVESGLIGFIEKNGPVDKTTWFDFDRVTFQSGSAKLDMANSDAQLNNLNEVLKAYPDVKLKIGGYTDSTGKADANLKLSQERADAVVAELVKKGVAADRLEGEGYGSQHPVASNATEEGRAKNRRMALRVTSLGDSAALAESAASDTSASEGDTLDADGELTEEEKLEARKANPLFSVMRPSVDAAGTQLIRGCGVGTARMADTAQVMRYLRTEAVKNNLPKDLMLAWSAKPFEGTDIFQLNALKNTVDGKPRVDGSVITNAWQDYDNTGEVIVTLRMNSEGAEDWRRMTGENVNKQVAIVLDGLVYSAPNVTTEIAGGSSQITMGGGRDLQASINEANDLATILKAGALPAPARIIDETVVGASIGDENVTMGLYSFIIALAMVLVVMILYYARAGWIADIALLCNVFFLIGAMASVQAVLTLPGIAGIVLTIGMAVDANVLIFERVREELKAGKMLKSAVDLGYKGALSAIIDSNVTTFVTGVILYIFGSGPIRGFATSLMIGILTSLFCAIFISRMIISWRLDKNKSISFWTNWSKNAFSNTSIDFMGKRKMFYAFSAVLVGISIFSMSTRGFNWGVDFTGGRTYVVKFDQAVDVDQVRETLEPAVKTVEGRQYSMAVKTYGSDSRLKITTNYLIEDPVLGTDSLVEAHLKVGLDKVGTSFAWPAEESRKVDATISDDIVKGAIYAVVIALVFMFVYITIRFRNWQYGVGALLSLAHDTVIVLGLYSLLWGIVGFSLEIDEAFIAVVLTVIGYSINDTVVVFDRIREYLSDHKRDDVETVFNKAMNLTLSRTIMTGLNVMFVLIIIFVMGSVSIQGFVFGLFAGIVFGTYSSIFVASAVAVDFLKRREQRQLAAAA